MSCRPRNPVPIWGILSDYLAYYRTNRRPRSARIYDVSWHALQPVLGSKWRAEIWPFDLERYRRQRKQAGRSDVTINRELAFQRNLYTMAITWGKATENPMKKVCFAREHNGCIYILTPEEEKELLIMYPENWTGDEDRMLCQYAMEEERGDVDTAETVEC